MKTKIVLLLLVIVLVIGCSPAPGTGRQHLKCYSNGVLIYDGIGKWMYGTVFIEEESGREVVPSGDCVGILLPDKLTN